MGLSTKQVSTDVQDWNQGDSLESHSGDSGRGSSMESQKPPTAKRQQEADPQPPAEKLKCPRCDSSNTKFCYYNNYNKSQPRHFCKACKRHWTKGGMLRNVPVGGVRKNKRLKTSKPPTCANVNVQASDQRVSLPLGLDYENTIRKPLFNNNMDLSIGKNSSSESDFGGIFGGSSLLSIPQNHDLKFPCPSFASLDFSFPCSISASGLNTGESNHLEETVMTGLDASLSVGSLNEKTWPTIESTSNWGWDDMDKFVISDVTIPWDDAEIN